LEKYQFTKGNMRFLDINVEPCVPNILVTTEMITFVKKGKGYNWENIGFR
jgi:hypothetical protein